MRTAGWAALALAFAAASRAGAATVPPVDGTAVGEDPFVKEYRETMTEVENEINKIRDDIKNMPQAVGQTAARIQKAEVAAKYAPMAALMLKGEQAQMKMLKHILLAEGSMDHEFDQMLGMRPPDFEQKGDADVKPKGDKTFKGRPGDAPKDREEQSDIETSPNRPEATPQGPEAPQQKASSGGSSDQPSVEDIVSGIGDRMKERQAAAARFLASCAK